MSVKAKRILLVLTGFLNRLIGCRIKVAWLRINEKYNLEVLAILVIFTAVWAVIIVFVLIPAFFALVAAIRA